MISSAYVTERLRNRLLIVCYHGVVEDTSPVRDWLHITATEFRAQVELLASRFQVVPIDEGLARLHTGKLTRPTACITFDDGYRNNATVAAPILSQLELPSTIYLATGLVGTPALLWTTAVSLAVRSGACASLDLTEWSGPKLQSHDPHSRAVMAREAVEHLKRLSQSDRVSALSGIDLSATLAQPGDEEYQLMSWNDVRGLAETGRVSFGGHTMGHEIVSRLSDNELRREVVGCLQAVREELASHAGDAVSKTFAYPNGRAIDFDHRCVELLREHGVSGAVTTLPGVNTTSTGSYELRRLVVGPRLPLRRFAWLATGISPLVSRALGVMRS